MDNTIAIIALALFGAWCVHCITRHPETIEPEIDISWAWKWKNLPKTKDQLLQFLDRTLDNYESSQPSNNEICARLEFTDGTIYVYNGGGFVEVEDRPQEKDEAEK